MKKERYNQVVNTLMQNTAGYQPHPNISPYPSDKEFKEAGKLLYKNTSSAIEKSESIGNHKFVGKSRTHNSLRQYDAYICEDGTLIAY